MPMMTTLNPKFGFLVTLLALVGFLYEVFHGNTGVVAFVLGYIYALPLVILIWRTMKKNWMVYRKFYSMTFHKRDMKTIKKHWLLTWWILPYTLIISSILDVIILLNPSLGSPYSFVFGAIFATFAYTALQSPRYYKDLKRKSKNIKKRKR